MTSRSDVDDDPREEASQEGGAPERKRRRKVGKLRVVRAVWRADGTAERVLARRIPALRHQVASGPRTEWNTMMYTVEQAETSSRVAG